MTVNPRLETNRLFLIPCPLTRMREKRDLEKDPHLKEAYSEMIAGMERHPEHWLWYTDWDLIRKTDQIVIGGFGFKGGPLPNGDVEIGYGLDEAFQHQGYMGEALRGAEQWAFDQPGVRRILAEVEIGNEASLRLLERNGYSLLSTGEGSHFFAKEKR